MPIPDKIAVTFCRTCEHVISQNQLCMPGCKWDGTTNVRERPVIVRTYWLRDEGGIKPYERPEPRR